MAARVGDHPFACGGIYAGIGITGTELTTRDFRFYVHDVRVTAEDGVEHPVALDDDGIWQHAGVALIDFEDGCNSGNAPMNTRLVGTIPADAGAITGLRFRVGVPEARNHINAATAPSPLNLTTMFWGWQAGYKYLRFDGSSTGQRSVLLHLGATGCTGNALEGTRTCTSRNVVDVSLDGFDPARDWVVADLAALFSTSDLDADRGGAPGCISDPDDPECLVLFEALGITPGSTQRLFRVEARPSR